MPPPELAPSLERKRLQIYIGQILLDAGILLGVFSFTAWIYLGNDLEPQHFVAGQLLLPLYLTTALQNGTYSLQSLTSRQTSIRRMAAAILTASLLLTFISFLGKFSATFSRVGFSLGLVTALAGMTGMRCLAIHGLTRSWGPSAMNVLVIEDGGPPVPLPHAFRISAAEHGLEPTLENPHALDRLARAIRNMDQVIVSCPPERREDWAMVLKGAGVHGELLSDVARDMGVLGVVHRGPLTSLLVSAGPLGMRARVSKRLLDLALSSMALLLLSPVLFAAALAIKLDDGGPIFFRQRRMGRRNEFFLIYKMRTMKVAEADADGHRSTEREDDRVTPVGRFLRRTSIDELPQLLNVIKGEMSRHAISCSASTRPMRRATPRGCCSA